MQGLLKLADAADQSSLPDGVRLPDEIKRREDRLAAIAAAKAKIEGRAAQRFEGEQAEYEAKLAKRQARQSKSGRKPGGKPPQPPEAGPRADEQVNLTHEDSRIAAASFTAVPRSLASAISPALGGALFAAGWLAAPLVACGLLKIA